jgi:NAD(P)-dependent dehydrogenase (short-subunit alcohol dehydrogenase family)
MKLRGKVTVVTGGSLGIGRATSMVLAREGAKVAITDIKDREGEKLVEQIRQRDGRATYWHLDTAQERQVERVFGEIAECLGGIDVLVNNAGISGVNKPTHQISEEEWERVMAVNVKGVFLCTKHAIPYLQKAGGGSIINLSSIYGIIGAGDIPPYHASKGAVRLMTKNDALQYAKDHIRVNSIHPGFIWTPLVEELGRQSPEGVEGFRAKLDALHPLGHVGEPEDIAYGVVYLASDEAAFVTGSELVIDGGYTAR